MHLNSNVLPALFSSDLHVRTKTWGLSHELARPQMRWAASSLTDNSAGRGHEATGYLRSSVCVDLELSSLTQENGRVFGKLGRARVEL